jgi:hypothetical protein
LNKTGYVFSLLGGMLAIVFSVLLVITGPFFFAGSDVYRFISDNSVADSQYEVNNIGKMWADIGDYYRIDPFLQSSLDDYISSYQDVLQNISAGDLEDMSKKYDLDSFHKLAVIYRNVEGYIPELETGFIACLIVSIAALVGAQVARRHHTAGGAVVLSAGALTIIFSLVARSILPMAFASVLLIIGGLLQIAKPKDSAEIQEQVIRSGGVY